MLTLLFRKAIQPTIRERTAFRDNGRRFCSSWYRQRQEQQRRQSAEMDLAALKSYNWQKRPTGRRGLSACASDATNRLPHHASLIRRHGQGCRPFMFVSAFRSTSTSGMAKDEPHDAKEEPWQNGADFFPDKEAILVELQRRLPNAMEAIITLIEEESQGQLEGVTKKFHEEGNIELSHDKTLEKDIDTAAGDNTGNSNLRIRFNEAWSEHCKMQRKKGGTRRSRRSQHRSGTNTETAECTNPKEWRAANTRGSASPAENKSAEVHEGEDNNYTFRRDESSAYDNAASRSTHWNDAEMDASHLNRLEEKPRFMGGNEDPTFGDKHGLGDIPQETETGVVAETARHGEIREQLEKICVFLESVRPSEWQLVDCDYHAKFVSDEIHESADDLETTEEPNRNEYTDGSDSFGVPGCDMDTVSPGADIEKMLDYALLNGDRLSVHDFNLILARLATSPDLFLESIMETLLQIYHLMTKHVAPDETTYKILLLTLKRRIAAGGTSSDGTIVTLVQDMINFNVKLSSGFLLREGTDCLDRENNLKVAKHLVVDFALCDKNRSFKVPKEAMSTLMKMFSREDRIEDAVILFKKCMEENGLANNRDTDTVLEAAIRWPDRNRAGQQRDIMHVLLAFLDVVLDDASRSIYEPGFKAWRSMIVALSRTTKADPTRWELLRRPLHALFERNREFYPDEFLLRIGLAYCEATGDTKIARDLVVRSADHHCSACRQTSGVVSSTKDKDAMWKTDSVLYDDDFVAASETAHSVNMDLLWCGSSVLDTFTRLETVPGESGATHAESTSTFVGFPVCLPDGGSDEVHRHNSPPFSYKVFQKAIKICIAADDTENGRSILDAFSRMQNVYPEHIESEIWGFALRGFSCLAHGADFVMVLFESMKDKGLKINEEIYGAVLHSFAVGNQPEEAIRLFREMKSKDGFQPALSCYNSIILASTKVKAFGDVLDLYDEMKAAPVMPDETTTQAVIIAAFRLGGREQVRQVLRETLEGKVVVSGDNCQLALKILMPDIVKGTANVTDIQRRLRDLGSENELLRAHCLDLLRSFRQADTEQRRVPTTNAPLDVLFKRREQAWHATMNHILQMDQIRRIPKRQQSMIAAQAKEITSPMA